MTSEHWKDEPEEQDYPAARSYLSLLVDPGEAKKTAKALAGLSAHRGVMGSPASRAA